MAGSLKSKLTVGAFLGITCAAMYAVAVVPLMSERGDQMVEPVTPGFKKGGMWRELSKREQQ